MDEQIEVIVQYIGDISIVQQELSAVVLELLGGYAILRLNPEMVGRLSEYPEILYVEPPRRLFFELNDGKAESCISEVQAPSFLLGTGDTGLSGNGVLVAVIDSGIDYLHSDFRGEDGATRIVALWDQSIAPGQQGIGAPYRGEEAFGYVYTGEDINRAIETGSRQEALRLVPSQDVSGHGTHVAGIAAGNGRAGGGRFRGVAYEADLAVVKLGSAGGSSTPQTAGLMAAVDFVLRTAIKRQQPVAVNISYGNNDGAHNGRNLVESYLTMAAQIAKSSIVIGTGNETTLGRHLGGFLREGTMAELLVEEGESRVEFWLWKNYFDRLLVSLLPPAELTQTEIVLLSGEEKKEAFVSSTYQTVGGVAEVLYTGPTPYNPLEQLSVTLRGEGGRLTGIWRLRLEPVDIVTGEYDIWLGGALISPDTRFLRGEELRTLTIPSTAGLPISVGAYDSRSGAVAYFSGRGYPRENNPLGGFVKPELLAPGVDIFSAAPGGGYTARTGTSMATPFVTGAAALLLEWGIVRGEDRSLYGQRLKAFLLRGAERRSGVVYPNREEGFGRLCVRNSLPI